MDIQVFGNQNHTQFEAIELMKKKSLDLAPIQSKKTNQLDGTLV